MFCQRVHAEDAIDFSSSGERSRLTSVLTKGFTGIDSTNLITYSSLSASTITAPPDMSAKAPKS